MPSPSLAEVVLTELLTINESVVDWHRLGEDPTGEFFRRIVRSMDKIERSAERRVDASRYEAHRRQVEACHVNIPAQTGPVGG